jgi:hypothetical protein
MRKTSFRRLGMVLAFCFLAVSLGSCGGGGGGGGSDSSDGSGGSDSTGSLAVNVGDAKPMLPPGTEKVLVTFDQVFVHRDEGTGAEGEWISLPLPRTPYTIDLLQFADGRTTVLAPPVKLETGKYTQIRIGVTSATIVISGVAYAAEIPSGKLRTDREFGFTVTGGGSVSLTVDFDLSQSLVVTGAGTFKLKPVLHLNQTQEAAAIQGKISAASFGASLEATVIVTQDKDSSGDLSPGDEEYTRLSVPIGSSDPTEFSVFWLVPNQSYIVQIEVGGAQIYVEPLSASQMAPGTAVPLHSDLPI